MQPRTCHKAADTPAAKRTTTPRQGTIAKGPPTFPIHTEHYGAVCVGAAVAMASISVLVAMVPVLLRMVF